jgi:hypothetical protein
MLGLRFGAAACAALVLCACDDKHHIFPWPDEAGTSDGGALPDVTDSEWEIVFEELDVALFAVWGTAKDDVWVVGSDSGDGPLVMHYDGDEWEVLDTGASGDLWWVSGRGDDVWMAGTDGLILRYSRDDEDFDDLSVADDVTLYGIFPTARDDVWAVGGGFTTDVKRAIYRFEGDEFELVDDLPDDVAEVDSPFFKVWGTSSDDLWIVGDGEYVLHRVEDEWEAIDVPDGRLFTVHGGGGYVAAVGGSEEQAAVLLEEDDGELSGIDLEDAPQLNGIWVRENGNAVAVGAYGVIFERRDGKWSEVEDVPLTAWDYHSVYIDPSGGQWAVGGQVSAPPYSSGMLSHRGKAVSSDGVPGSD